MTDNVVFLPIRITDGKLDPERILQKAIEAGMADVLVVGVMPDGRLYCASSTDAREAMLFAERAKIEILKSMGVWG